MGDHRCILCVDFVSSEKEAMKRHVAIVHGEDTFSTMQCDVCQRKFYDLDQFQEHVRESPACFTDCLKVTPLQLNEYLEKAFISLVDQMMKPVAIQNVSIPSTESADHPEPVVQESASPNNASALQNSSSSSIKTSIKTEFVDDSKTPETVSSVSIAEQTAMDAESGIQKLENEMTMDSSAAQEMDIQHDVADGDAVEKMDEDGLGPKLERRSRKSVERYGIDVGRSSITSKRTSSSAIKKSEQDQTRSKHNVDDFRFHCRQIIKKRIHNGRLTCSKCNGSLSATNGGHPLDHIRGHFPVPLIRCRRCTFKAKYFKSIYLHLHSAHGAPSDQYVDELADNADEFMKMFDQCFDHDLQGGNIERSGRISKRQSLQFKTDYGELSVDHGSTSMSDELMRGGLMEQEIENEGAVDGDLSTVNQNRDQGDISRDLTENNLRLHCRQIIVKHLHENRITCSLCKKSIIATQLNGTPNHHFALKHAQGHLVVPIFNCQGCNFKSNYAKNMRLHASGKHGSLDQYTDTTPDRIGELMELVTRCFDQDIPPGTSSAVSNRLGISSAGIETIGQEMETDQTVPSGDNGSISNSGEFTVASAIKLQRSMRKIMIGEDSRGPKGIKRLVAQQRKPRNKSDPGKKRGHAKNSSMKTWSPAPPHIQRARRECLEKVQKSVKNGKLQCRLCPQSIVVLEKSGIGDKFRPAIAHATRHVEGCNLFECSKCHTVTKTRISMYDHAKKCQKGGQGKCIDRSNQYYREIFDQVLKCFDLETASQEQATTSTGIKKVDIGKLDGECSTSAATDKKNYLVCDKCHYKTEYQRLLDMHQKVIHSKQVVDYLD